MSKTKQSDTERAKLQGLWRAAGQRTAPLEVPTGTLAVARNLRFALYNAVREERNQPGLADQLLAEALDTIQLSVVDNPPRLVLSRKSIITLLDNVLGDVPELAGLSKTAMEARADASAAKLAQIMAEAPPERAAHAADQFREAAPTFGKPNPFYSRDSGKPGSTS